MDKGIVSGCEVVTCHTCAGRGTLEQRSLTDYHRGEYDYWNITCGTCEGSGRLTRKVVVTYYPYVNAEVDDERGRGRD